MQQSHILSLKNWILDHIELDEKSTILEDINLINVGREFIIENKNILTFKDLQNNIYKADLKDFFLDIIKKKSNFEHQIIILKDLYLNRLLSEFLEIYLQKISEEVENIKKEINYDSFINNSLEESSLRNEIESRLNYIETLPSIIKSNQLIQKNILTIQSLEITNLWQNIWSMQYSLESIKSVINDYFKNKSQFEILKNELQNNDNELDLLSQFIQKFLDPKFKKHDHSTINLDVLEKKPIIYLDYLPTLQDSIRYLELKNTLTELSIKDFWDNFLKSNISHREIIKVFKKSFYLQILKKHINKNELISDTKKTSEIIIDFKQFDKNSIKINKNRIFKNINQNLSKTVNKYCIDFLELKCRERFPKPRKIISKYRDIFLNVFGCVVCSPLTICEYFEMNKQQIDEPIFDVVIFDEASQIFTSDALSSIFRAKQIIIAGDSYQMPPTNLFNNKDTSEDDSDFEEDYKEEDINDYPGLLSYSTMKLPEISLNWHYRSKFEELIYPSNQFVYKGRLITFPNSNKTTKPIVFHYLPEGIWEKQTNNHEAKYVIQLLKEIYDTGARSVGVISINSKQQELIRSLISCNINLNDWLDSDDEDGLFVKNLENCQGDERDIIIICSSYAKNKEGKIDGRMFQQLNSENSYKRLNVMFSRAKQKIHLLSSLKWQDIKNDTTKQGIDFFQKYLQFAETNIFGITSKNHIKQDDFDSGFEESVYKSLRSLGYEIHSQVGCSGYKIDLAVVCPNTTNYILGIECDGEMYHSGKTARERDRLRQEVLESKGWNIHRIWSYDWIDSKKEELEKLKKKIDNLIIQ